MRSDHSPASQCSHRSARRPRRLFVGLGFSLMPQTVPGATPGTAGVTPAPPSYPRRRFPPRPRLHPPMELHGECERDRAVCELNSIPIRWEVSAERSPIRLGVRARAGWRRPLACSVRRPRRTALSGVDRCDHSPASQCAHRSARRPRRGSMKPGFSRTPQTVPGATPGTAGVTPASCPRRRFPPRPRLHPPMGLHGEREWDGAVCELKRINRTRPMSAPYSGHYR